MRLDSLRTRIQDLESGLGVVTLEDGSRFHPSAEGLRLLRISLKISRSLGRDPQLEDFSSDDRELLGTFAKWKNPGTGFGQLSILVCDLARGLTKCE
jgi:hypothetical protein